MGVNSQDQKENDTKEHKIEEVTWLQNEKLKAEVNIRNQELAYVMQDLIDKDQLLFDIKQNLQNTQTKGNSKEFKEFIKSIIDKIDGSVNQERNSEMFQIHFNRVHIDFMDRLKEKHPGLSKQNMKIAAYIRMNLSSNEMAKLLNISVNGVEKARYRFRKKLNLSRNENLVKYISTI